MTICGIYEANVIEGKSATFLEYRKKIDRSTIIKLFINGRMFY